MKNNFTHKKLATWNRNGFALISSLMIMMLLMLVALAMLSLSSTTTRSAAVGKGVSEAKANARMALMLAIGKLQTTLGPDKRISARGATLVQHEELLDTSVPTSVQAKSAKAWWVGAASSDVTETIGSGNQAVVWLVSGLDPSATSSEQIESTSPFQQEVVMFGKESIDLTLTDGEPLTAGAVPIIDDQGTKIGSYAYFVDDNGMKAQLTPSHPEVANGDPSTARPGGTVIPGSYGSKATKSVPIPNTAFSTPRATNLASFGLLLANSRPSFDLSATSDTLLPLRAMLKSLASPRKGIPN